METQEQLRAPPLFGAAPGRPAGEAGATFLRLVPAGFATTLERLRQAQGGAAPVTLAPASARAQLAAWLEVQGGLRPNERVDFIIDDIAALARMAAEAADAASVQAAFHKVGDSRRPFLPHAGLRLIYDVSPNDQGWAIAPIEAGSRARLGPRALFVDITAFGVAAGSAHDDGARRRVFLEKLEQYKSEMRASKALGVGEMRDELFAKLVELDPSLMGRDYEAPYETGGADIETEPLEAIPAGEAYGQYTAMGLHLKHGAARYETHQANQKHDGETPGAFEDLEVIVAEDAERDMRAHEEGARRAETAEAAEAAAHEVERREEHKEPREEHAEHEERREAHEARAEEREEAPHEERAELAEAVAAEAFEHHEAAIREAAGPREAAHAEYAEAAYAEAERGGKAEYPEAAYAEAEYAEAERQEKVEYPETEYPEAEYPETPEQPEAPEAAGPEETAAGAEPAGQPEPAEPMPTGGEPPETPATSEQPEQPEPPEEPEEPGGQTTVKEDPQKTEEHIEEMQHKVEPQEEEETRGEAETPERPEEREERENGEEASEEGAENRLARREARIAVADEADGENREGPVAHMLRHEIMGQSHNEAALYGAWSADGGMGFDSAPRVFRADIFRAPDADYRAARAREAEWRSDEARTALRNSAARQTRSPLLEMFHFPTPGPE